MPNHPGLARMLDEVLDALRRLYDETQGLEDARPSLIEARKKAAEILNLEAAGVGENDLS